MKQFNFKDWDIEPEIEKNRDDFIYGNYVDWDRFRGENEENLLDYFEVYLPWDKKITIIEYLEFITQSCFQNTKLVNKYNFDELSICKQGEDLSDLIIQFISRDNIDANNLIADIFDYCGIPAGVQYEQELPEELQYWANQFEGDYLDNEYEYYKIHPIKIMDYKDTIHGIQSKISNFKDELVIKSLILSSLIISESLIKSVISNNLPEERGLSEFTKNIIEKTINDKLTRTNGRNELFKDIFGKKAPKQKWINLRNSLAHDVESVNLFDGKINYTNLKDEKLTYGIDDLFEDLLRFSEELQASII